MSSLVTLVPRPSSPLNVEGGFGDETTLSLLQALLAPVSDHTVSNQKLDIGPKHMPLASFPGSLPLPWLISPNSIFVGARGAWEEGSGFNKETSPKLVPKPLPLLVYVRLASFPGSFAPEREIEFRHAERAWERGYCQTCVSTLILRPDSDMVSCRDLVNTLQASRVGMRLWKVGCLS